MKQQKVTSMDCLMPVFLERLAAGQSIQFSPQGTSMLPMLRQGVDSVVVSPLSQRLKRYDVVLYQRGNGQYVLHRIVEMGDTYTCLGDNQFTKEYGIKHEQVIAVVTSFERNGRVHEVKECIYQLYCRVWYHSRLLRHFWRRGVEWLRRNI